MHWQMLTGNVSRLRFSVKAVYHSELSVLAIKNTLRLSVKL